MDKNMVKFECVVTVCVGQTDRQTDRRICSSQNPAFPSLDTVTISLILYAMN